MCVCVEIGRRRGRTLTHWSSQSQRDVCPAACVVTGGLRDDESEDEEKTVEARKRWREGTGEGWIDRDGERGTQAVMWYC